MFIYRCEHWILDTNHIEKLEIYVAKHLFCSRCTSNNALLNYIVYYKYKKIERSHARIFKNLILKIIINMGKLFLVGRAIYGIKVKLNLRKNNIIKWTKTATQIIVPHTYE